MANSAPALFSVIDVEERYVFVNSELEKAIGIPKGDLVGRRVREMVSDRVYALTRDFFDRAWSGENVDFEIGLRLPEGKRLWLAANFVPHRNEAGEIDCLYTFASDITAKQGLCDVLRSRRGTLAHTLRLNTAGELARAWAHQISQPLGAVAGFVEECADLLQHPDFDVDAVSDLLDRGSASALRAGEIVHRIRGFLRAEQPQHASTDLRDIVQDATQLILGEAEMGACPMHVVLPDESVPISCNRVQLQQACLNLLRNALDASSPGSSEDDSLAVVVERYDDGFAEVVVRDHGVGIEPALLGRAFEAFFSTKPGRLGLGLTIAQSIVESHDGRISIEPREDAQQGCTARVRIPLETVTP